MSERSLTFVGWYGRRNAGDEAFRAVHEQLFPGVPKRWVTDPREAGDPAGQVFVLGAGDVFLDFYLSMIPAGAPFFAYGVGLGSPEQYRRVQAERERLLGLWVRNEDDAAALRELGIEADYTPDITLLLGEAVRARPAHPVLEATTRKRLVFCPSSNADQTALQRGDLADHFYASYMKVILARTLDELAAYYDIVLLPLSHDYKDLDLSFLGQVHGLMRRPERAFPVVEELPPLDVARLIGDCQLCLSMKFHGLVFAALGGTPFVNLGLTRKTALFCQELGAGAAAVPAYALTQASLLAAVKRAEAPETREALGAIVATRVARARSAAAAFRQRVLEALEG